jgi:ribonuclease J
MAMEDHRYVKIEQGDTVVISANAIPGNEDTILRVINNLCRLGAHVIHPIHAHHRDVHASGHGNIEELKLMLNLARPHYVIPVHGEYRHLAMWKEMAAEMEYVAIPLENGDVLEMDEEEAVIVEHVTAGAVFLDGTGFSDVEDVVLRDRRHLAQDGIFIVVVSINQETGKTIAGPDVVSRGSLLTSETESINEEARQRVVELLEALPSDAATIDLNTLRTDIRRSLNKFLQARTGRRPMVVPIVMEI